MYASPAIKAQSLDGFNDSFQLVPPKCPPGAWRPGVAKPLRMAPWVSLKMGGSTSQNGGGLINDGPKWMVQHLKIWMMNRGSPISGNLPKWFCFFRRCEK